MSRAEIITAIIGIVFLISATWIPLYIYRIGRFNKAAETFRTIFERIMATIHQNPNLTACQIAEDILVKNYPDQSIAMESLSKQIWCTKRCAFRKAWQEYKDPEDCGDEPFLSYCGMPYEEGKSFDRQYILDAIKHLISFANK